MKLLVIGSGMMGSAAAFDMARTLQVESVTLADNDGKRAREVAARVNRISGARKVRAVVLDAAAAGGQNQGTQPQTEKDLSHGFPRLSVGSGCAGPTIPEP